ncbi:NAD-dependent epimerase/dehydratase family protein [Allobranchiibius huperziae]|uniref:Nucleoside-diphosphate-sugar epimerase n=1 Tax=Allobranchiibius huperziae TaxID=1874116 RepID=A0A853DGE3_9MICO|nr:NAD-dependent epimerase/dehydratase family protein [Allobranchiibius huperziae]NYJ75757.1 nucleoside-diphosphate-sugar epimerase [Allobranchiibius huperziae]
MDKHVVVGAGPVGSAVAQQLVERGAEVVVVTRSGTAVPGTTAVAADASNAARLSEICAGARAIYNCINPPYDQWQETWPPMAQALLAAAESSGAVLVTTASLYPYGPVDGPMTQGMPDSATGHKAKVRARMTADAMEAHRAGRLHAVEVRGSDYLGGNSYMEATITPAFRKGRTAYVPADLDAPHTFTNVQDMARTLIAAAYDPSSWGKVWHAPSVAPSTMRELATIAAAQLGAKPKVRSMPYAAVWIGGVFNPFIKEMRETQYQFRGPYVMDSSAAQEHFGITPTPLEDSVRLDLAHTAQRA